MPYTKSMTDKKCSVCGGIFPATTEYFYKHTKSLHSKCKICYNKYQSEKQQTPEYKAKRLKRLTSQREHINKRQREYYAANPEKWNKYYKDWDKSHPDAALARVHKRRARKLLNGTEPYTRKDMLDKYGAVCYICSNEIDLSISGKVGSLGWENGLHIEHVVPLSAGGPDTLENVRPSHGKCNLNKGTK
jgi:hypothetical protein